VVADTGRVISSAALIMVAIFASFVLYPDPVVKMFGVGLAVVVTIDATVVRGILVPSTMVLLGRVNWWVPGSLDRFLPHIDIHPVSDDSSRYGRTWNCAPGLPKRERLCAGGSAHGCRPFSSD